MTPREIPSATLAAPSGVMPPSCNCSCSRVNVVTRSPQLQLVHLPGRIVRRHRQLAPRQLRIHELTLHGHSGIGAIPHAAAQNGIPGHGPNRIGHVPVRQATAREPGRLLLLLRSFVPRRARGGIGDAGVVIEPSVRGDLVHTPAEVTVVLLTTGGIGDDGAAEPVCSCPLRFQSTASSLLSKPPDW